MKKIIFIDWYKTLSVSRFWDGLEMDHPHEHSLIVSCFLNKFGDLVNPWMRGEYTSEDICEMISKDTHLDFDLVFENLVRSAQNMNLSHPEVIEMVESIRKKSAKVFIATDNMDTFNRWTVPSLELEKYFDGILNSWDLKALKMDFDLGKSLFFDQFIRKEISKPEECVLIDDSEDKNDVIKKYGIKYMRIESPEEALSKLKELSV